MGRSLVQTGYVACSLFVTFSHPRPAVRSPIPNVAGLLIDFWDFDADEHHQHNEEHGGIHAIRLQ